jgi:penicillin-binding protein 2
VKLEAQTETDPTVSTRRRLIIMAVVSAATFIVILFRLYTVQVRRGAEFQEKSQDNFVQFNRIEHDRGEIMDREGRLLVTNIPSVNIDVTPAFFPRTLRMINRLGGVAGLTDKQIEAVLGAVTKAAEEKGPPILLAKDLKERTVRKLRAEQRQLEIPLVAIPVIEMPDPADKGLYAAFLDPEHFPTAGRVIRRLTDGMQLTQGELDTLKKRIARASGLDIYLPIIVRRDVSPDIEERVTHEVRLGDLPGVAVRRAKTRHYEFEDMAAHFLGYVNELSPAELEELREQGYRLGDTIGRRGVEKSFEAELRGTDGREAVIVDSKGRPHLSQLAMQLQDRFAREEPIAGGRVYTTIDLDLQRVAEKSFPGRAGAVVMLEVHTGRVLVMTSTPSFNPNLVTGFFDPREKKRLDENKTMRPWRFRAIQDFFAPGSTMKPITSIAALENHALGETEAINCPGAFHLGATRFRCFKEAGHGPLILIHAIERSCDVFFYTLGARMGLDAIARVGLDLGLGTRTGIPLDGESNGIMPTQRWYKEHLPEGYTLGAAVNVAVGQGATSVTPIQLAVVYGTIANGGQVYEPQIGLRIEPSGGGPPIEIPPKLRREVQIPKRILDLVHEGLRRVVNEGGGTAYSRRLKDISVSGKTGTAQVAKFTRARGTKLDTVPYEMRDNAWFASYAPSNDPEVVVVVLNEHGGFGGNAAAPAAMATIEAWWQKKQAQARSEGAKVKTLEIAVLLDEPGEGGDPWPAD